MVIYSGAFAAGYLLVLAPDAVTTPETELADHLARACGSGRPAVWVDCRLLATLSATAAGLLGSCQRCLASRGVPLVLCHASERVQHVVQDTLRGVSGLRHASSLDAAAGLTAPTS